MISPSFLLKIEFSAVEHLVRQFSGFLYFIPVNGNRLLQLKPGNMTL
jgi:hypothetical protein